MGKAKLDIFPNDISALMFELNLTRTTDELFDAGEAFDKKTGMMTKAFMRRFYVLEKFYQEFMEGHTVIKKRIRGGDRAERDKAIAHFTAMLGLKEFAHQDRNQHYQYDMLTEYALHLARNGYQEEIMTSWLEDRSAEIPRDVRVLAVEYVQQEFGLASYSAAARALHRARARIRELPPGLHQWCSHLEIPGGEE